MITRNVTKRTEIIVFTFDKQVYLSQDRKHRLNLED